MEKLTVSAAPHIHSGAFTNRIMLDVVIALLPVTVASVVIFGLKALIVLASCVMTALVAEFLNQFPGFFLRQEAAGLNCVDQQL